MTLSLAQRADLVSSRLHAESDRLNEALASLETELLAVGSGIKCEVPLADKESFLVLDRTGLSFRGGNLSAPLAQCSRLIRCSAAHAIPALLEVFIEAAEEEHVRVTAAADVALSQVARLKEGLAP